MFNSKISERGITLIISIVLLAAVSFISFVLSAIIIREIMATRLLLKTEPAISGANSGGEVGLFRLIRQVGGVSATGQLPQSQVAFTVTANLYVDSYPFNVPAGGEVRVLLYDVENEDNKNADYGSVTVTNNASSNPIKYDVYSWSDFDNAICSGTIGSGQSSPPCALNYPGDDRYIVVIACDSPSNTATGFLTATNNGGAAKGIPADSPTLDVVGSKDEVQRKIQIRF